jgi:NAD(P)-dependent dehydrogenase (short-subunit alcohol dehydrogenase family)
MSRWTVADIPPQTGKTAIVTGANSGLGFETALALARAGATVVMASRSESKGHAAVDRVKAKYSGAKVVFMGLDLASLASVRDFAAQINATLGSLDMLINNAGVMALLNRQVTQDGFEMQIGVNYLGHFALAALLLPLLRQSKKPRVVQLSSIAHKRGAINLDDLNSERNYKPWPVYSQSKLAMLIFALELQRRSDRAGWGILSTAAHPGFSRTALIENGPGPGLMATASAIFAPLVSQSAAAGALGTLMAATWPQVSPGGYYGPQGFQDLKGPPGPAQIMPQAKDQTVAKKLWDLSEALTGISFKSAP